MPCRVDTGQPLTPPDELNIDLMNELIAENKTLKAQLCAVLTELQDQGLFTQIVPKATVRGQIDIMSFWQKHRQEDIDRMNKKLESFSAHEKEIIKEILTKN